MAIITTESLCSTDFAVSKFVQNLRRAGLSKSKKSQCLFSTRRGCLKRLSGTYDPRKVQEHDGEKPKDPTLLVGAQVIVVFSLFANLVGQAPKLLQHFFEVVIAKDLQSLPKASKRALNKLLNKL